MRPAAALLVLAGCGGGGGAARDGGPDAAPDGGGIPADAPGILLRVDRGADDAAGDGAAEQSMPGAGGRLVAFRSLARNLVPAGSNGYQQIFWRDTCLGIAPCTPSTQQISLSTEGVEGNEFSVEPAITPDGRYVVFSSGANNLVPDNDRNGTDIYIRDSCHGASGCTPFTLRLSKNDAGVQANRGSLEPSVSADARYVVFRSLADNLVTGDRNGTWDVFLKDDCIGAPAGCVLSVQRVSLADDGSEANGLSTHARLSASGRHVAFRSAASNLVPGDNNGLSDVFVRDTCLGAVACSPSTARVSVASDGSEPVDPSASDGDAPAISADGRYLAFTSPAANLVAGDDNGRSDVFLRDTCAGAAPGCTPSTTRVSLAAGGGELGAPASEPSIDAGGRIVAFRVHGAGTAASPDGIFVRDTCTGAPPGCVPRTVRVSSPRGGPVVEASCGAPALSPDGHTVTFHSAAPGLPGAAAGRSAIYLALTSF